MNATAGFLEAALPEPVTILRKRLRPFCVGHKMHLERHGNPFVAGGRSPNLADLFMAVFFCSQRYEEGQENLEDPELDRKFRRWEKLVGPVGNEFALFRWFREYVANGSRGPIWREVTEHGARRGPPPGAPLDLVLLNTLTAYLGFSQSEAINCPYGEALWRYCAYWESHGRLRIVSEAGNSTTTALREAAAKLGLKPIVLSREEQEALMLSGGDLTRK